jgi:hypothetical protein
MKIPGEKWTCPSALFIFSDEKPVDGHEREGFCPWHQAHRTFLPERDGQLLILKTNHQRSPTLSFQLFILKIMLRAISWWLTPMILATLKAEVRRIMVQGQSWQKFIGPHLNQ